MNPLDCEAVEETAEELASALQQLEAELGREYGIRGATRLGLLKGLRSGQIRETVQVTKWLGLYSAYMRWLEHEPCGTTDERDVIHTSRTPNKRTARRQRRKNKK